MSNNPVESVSNNPKPGIRAVVIRSNGTIARVVCKINGVTQQQVRNNDRIYTVDHNQNPPQHYVETVGRSEGKLHYQYLASDWFGYTPRLSGWLFHALGPEQQIPQGCGWDGVTTFQMVRMRTKLGKFMSEASKGMVELVASRLGEHSPNWRWEKAKVLSKNQPITTPGTWIFWPQFKEVGCWVSETSELSDGIPSAAARAIFMPRDPDKHVEIYTLR